MVKYSLLHPEPETDGVMQVCHAEGIRLIPYAPLAEGILTGKYRHGRRLPIGYAAAIYLAHLGITDKANRKHSLQERIFSKPPEMDRKRLESLSACMDQTAAKYDCSPAQIALNWLLSCDQADVVPIPGVKTPAQVLSNAGALGWKMTKEDRDTLSASILQR